MRTVPHFTALQKAALRMPRATLARKLFEAVFQRALRDGFANRAFLWRPWMARAWSRGTPVDTASSAALRAETASRLRLTPRT